ncbi:MAG: UDP-N-acetylmuramate--L-alanine ligase [Patescibacteria group bacterium]|nr:UDP-N-acetylmuramate--L-alanine ligase [Patescibacteria group bacterium]
MLECSRFFLMGIKGAAMANIALLLHQMGKNVSGIDVGEVFPTDAVLTDAGIPWYRFGELRVIPPDVEVIVFAAAHQADSHELVRQAQASGIRVVHQAALLGELIARFPRSIAVAGCHGKTTTSSMLACALLKLNVDPSYMVGAPSFRVGSGTVHPGGRVGHSEYFVIEADEYALHPPVNRTPKFHLLKPAYAIITNIDYDHPDVYASFAETKEAFLTFAKRTGAANGKKRLFLCADDDPLREVTKGLATEAYQTYGFSSDADYRIQESAPEKGGMTFTLSGPENLYHRFSIALPGEKNVLNAAAVIGVLHRMGFSPDAIATAIGSFRGAKRRFELVSSGPGYVIYDDYAHHPAELRAVISAAKIRHPHARIRVVFQPHTFSRTKSLLEDFVDALALAEEAIVLPIFASARERADGIVSSKLLIEHATRKGITTMCDISDASALRKVLANGRSNDDVVIMAGAGDVYALQPDVLLVYSAQK